MPDDFELRLEYLISDKGNSGINYRSERMDDAPYALNDTINSRFSGLLAVQVHVGPPMRIAYRNIRVKRL